MNKNIKQLNKAYSKRFKQLNKNMLITENSWLMPLVGDGGLIVFVEYLRYLRDIYIITQQSPDSIATLNAAIEEFEAHAESKKEFHWNNFCEFVRLNMREWLATNDSV
jgi:hypothetical protein